MQTEMSSIPDVQNVPAEHNSSTAQELARNFQEANEWMDFARDLSCWGLNE
jgi:hypothetical protein